jgi:hypothetical protein
MHLKNIIPEFILKIVTATGFDVMIMFTNQSKS